MGLRKAGTREIAYMYDLGAIPKGTDAATGASPIRSCPPSIVKDDLVVVERPERGAGRRWAIGAVVLMVLAR